jgi:hypothetical protein
VNTRQRIALLERTLTHQLRLRSIARNRGQTAMAKSIGKRIGQVRGLLRALENLD